jgi:hypothetical protein
MKLGRIAMRNISRNRRRSLLSGSATAIASMSIVLFFSLAAGMIGNLEDNMAAYVTGHLRILNREYQENELINPLHLNIEGYKAIAEELRAYPGIEAFPRGYRFPPLSTAPMIPTRPRGWESISPPNRRSSTWNRPSRGAPCPRQERTRS